MSTTNHDLLIIISYCNVSEDQPFTAMNFCGLITISQPVIVGQKADGTLRYHHRFSARMRVLHTATGPNLALHPKKFRIAIAHVQRSKPSSDVTQPMSNNFKPVGFEATATMKVCKVGVTKLSEQRRKMSKTCWWINKAFHNHSNSYWRSQGYIREVQCKAHLPTTTK